MVFNTQDNVQKARIHIESGDDGDLKYACLELRFALEKIAYQKLKLRLKKIAAEEIEGWQPRQVMQCLKELTDNYIEENFTLSMGPDNATDNKQFKVIGRNKGVRIKEITKYWHKLGSELHADLPKKGQLASTKTNTKLREFLEEVILYIEEIAKTGFDAHFSMDVTFSCSKCEKTIIRNRELLSDKDVVQCQNENCTASFIVHIKDENYDFEPYYFDIKCQNCGHVVGVEANALLETPYKPYRPGKFLECPECKCKHEVDWTLQYRKHNEA